MQVMTLSIKHLQQFEKSNPSTKFSSTWAKSMQLVTIYFNCLNLQIEGLAKIGLVKWIENGHI